LLIQLLCCFFSKGDMYKMGRGGGGGCGKIDHRY